jgi:hypothetical protein
MVSTKSIISLACGLLESSYIKYSNNNYYNKITTIIYVKENKNISQTRNIIFS